MVNHLHEDNHDHDHDQVQHVHVQAVDEDPAMRSLSDALKYSFVLMRVIMIFFVLMFLATGIDTVESTEKGIVKVFGSPVRVVEPGIVFNWPYPIGEIEKVSTAEQVLPIKDFWPFIRDDESTFELSNVSFDAEGLRPGLDGYLLTGDRKIIHMNLECRYRIEDVLAYAKHVTMPEKVMRIAICDAAVHSASNRTSDALLQDPTEFLAEIEKKAQLRLDQLMETVPEKAGTEEIDRPRGLRIERILLENKTWPLKAFDAYEQAQSAKAERRGTIDTAISNARGKTDVVGESVFVQLAGEPWLEDQTEVIEKSKSGNWQGHPYNLIGTLEKAMEKKDTATEAACRNRINAILGSTATGGEVRAIIASAEAERESIQKGAWARSERFTRLMKNIKQNGGDYEGVKQKIWMDLLEEILDNPQAEEFYLMKGQKVIHIRSDPKVEENIRRWKRTSEDEKKKEKEG